MSPPSTPGLGEASQIQVLLGAHSSDIAGHLRLVQSRSTCASFYINRVATHILEKVNQKEGVALQVGCG